MYGVLALQAVNEGLGRGGIQESSSGHKLTKTKALSSVLFASHANSRAHILLSMSCTAAFKTRGQLCTPHHAQHAQDPRAQALHAAVIPQNLIRSTSPGIVPLSPPRYHFKSGGKTESCSSPWQGWAAVRALLALRGIPMLCSNGVTAVKAGRGRSSRLLALLHCPVPYGRKHRTPSATCARGAVKSAKPPLAQRTSATSQALSHAPASVPQMLACGALRSRHCHSRAPVHSKL